MEILNKEIYPKVVNLRQYASGTDILDFMMEEYVQDGIDLSKLKPYAVCTMPNKKIDKIELASEIVEEKLKITWKVTEYTTIENGVVNYVISFEDFQGTRWNSYQAIMFVNSNIMVDDKIAAMYPTILKQWEERMNGINDQVDIDLEEIREAVQTTTDNASKTDADAKKTAEDAERTQKLKEYVESIVNYEPSDSVGKEVAEARGDFLTLGQRLDDMDEKNDKKTEDIDVLLSAGSWNSNKYTFSDERLTSSTDADLETSPLITDEQYEQIANARISRTIELSNGSMVLTALGDVPTVDIPLILKVRSWQ